jgi:hypothetical protein
LDAAKILWTTHASTHATRRDETRRDETRREETRRDEKRRDVYIEWVNDISITMTSHSTLSNDIFERPTPDSPHHTMAHFLCPHLSLALLPSLLTTTQHVTHRIPASRVPQHNHPLGSRFRGAAYSSICFCVFEEGVVSDGVGLTHGLREGREEEWDEKSARGR